MNRPPEEYVRVPANGLRSFACQCLQRVGLHTDHARQLADLLVNSDLRGVRSHGTRMLGDTPHGPAPLRLAGKFRGELYCGFAEHDRHMTVEQIREIADLLEPHKVKYRYVVHPGAIHGYSLPDRDVYDKAAAERDWEHIFAMFHRQIPP